MNTKMLPTLVYQSLEQVKKKITDAGTELLTSGDDAANEEQFARIIHHQFGKVNYVFLISVLAMLCASEADSIAAYGCLANEASDSEVTEQQRKRELKLVEKLAESQQENTKLKRENEEFRRANHRWAQDYESLSSRVSAGTATAQERELEKRLRTEKSNYEMLLGKYQLLEETIKEERTELIALRKQQEQSEDLMTRVEQLEKTLNDVNEMWDEDKKTKERYRLERNRYFHDQDRQRKTHEEERKKMFESIRNLESQCDRMRAAFAQVSDIVYAPKSVAAKPSKKPATKPPGHFPRSPMNCSDVERDRVSKLQHHDEQVTGVTTQLTVAPKPALSNQHNAHTVNCSTCSSTIPMDKFLEHTERCTVYQQ